MKEKWGNLSRHNLNILMFPMMPLPPFQEFSLLASVFMGGVFTFVQIKLAAVHLLEHSPGSFHLLENSENVIKSEIFLYSLPNTMEYVKYLLCLATREG